MGLAVTRDDFRQEDYIAFKTQLHSGLAALKQLLEREDFGVGPSTIGAEVEYYIIDHNLNVLPRNQEILAQCNEPGLTVELNRFNLEYNSPPLTLTDAPFLALQADLNNMERRLNRIADQFHGRIIPIGILPTLTQRDFHPHTMTDIPRYRVLSRALRSRRGAPFRIDIDGADPLRMEMEDVTLEGASTSYQIHWRVPPRKFAAYFNAVQLVTPIALALAANSPSLFGHLLWDETRIALFKQSIDTRLPLQIDWHHPPRVSFGEGWVREGAWELFAEAIALYPVIMPVTSTEDPLAVVEQGGIPKLEELRLHQGTTWPWNRAIYDPADGGHLRIEMRALPSGPTAIDMSANALFLIGAALAVEEGISHFSRVLPFRYAEQNFYRAAKYGIDANLIWPSRYRAELREVPLLEVALQLLPLIRDKLLQIPLNAAEVEQLLQVIEGRIEQRITPARWQRHMLARFEAAGHSRDDALHAMLSRYLEEQNRQRPVCEWSLEP